MNNEKTEIFPLVKFLKNLKVKIYREKMNVFYEIGLENLQ